MSTTQYFPNAPTAGEQRAIDNQHGGFDPLAKAAIVDSLAGSPLGTFEGEASLQSPYNSPGVRVPNVYIRNWSRTKERKVCRVAVSSSSGGEEALRYSKTHKTDKTYGDWFNLFTVQSLQEEAKRHDMSIYETVIEPCVLQVKVDGKLYYIEPAREDDKDNPPLELVPEGTWDLYLGNYERMHNTAKPGDLDYKIREDAMTAELARIGALWMKKKNPVAFTTVDGRHEDRKNPFGFVEFIRETPNEAPRHIDKPYLTALELVEG